MTAFIHFYYYYNRSCLTKLRVNRIGVCKDYLIFGKVALSSMSFSAFANASTTR